MKGKIMDKRTLVKYVAKTIVMSSAGSIITKALLNAVPSSERYNIAEITGAVGGWYIAEKLEPTTDDLVEKYFDHRDAKNTITA